LLAPAIDNSIYPMEMREFQAFRSLIHEHTGIWLRDGKQIMLASRLSRRLRHYGMADFAEYYRYVQQSPNNGDEIRELINCVTTNKTSFFRERHHFEFLANTVIPESRDAVLQGAPRRIRVWSAACSTGEEPYTIAIALLEGLQPARGDGAHAHLQPSGTKTKLPGFTMTPGSWKIEVVASDIDTNVLNTAKHAVYSEDSLDSVPAMLKKKYFLRGKDEMRGYVKVKPEITRLVQFSHINLKDAKWPLEGIFDAIFFRNALIYFKQDTQDMFLRRMVRFLKPGGYLFLGNAEHIPWLHNILEPLNQTTYRLRDVKQ
jgi:chemotaxis protein methyltransferase CheR